jgi:hypothetical protein
MSDTQWLDVAARAVGWALLHSVWQGSLVAVAIAAFFAPHGPPRRRCATPWRVWGLPSWPRPGPRRRGASPRSAQPGFPRRQAA